MNISTKNKYISNCVMYHELKLKQGDEGKCSFCLDFSSNIFYTLYIMYLDVIVIFME